jgi:5'-3' exonuclease
MALYTIVRPLYHSWVDSLVQLLHAGSHPNDEDAHFRLSEEQIFTSIFTYVDHLFGKIKPKKLFFMAVDGVAPRAKMNQQRSRRFRTAKEAKDVRDKALRNGEELPKEKAFDSNCITPGAFHSYESELCQSTMDDRNPVYDEVVRTTPLLRQQEDY